MVWIIGIFKFIFAAIAIFFSLLYLNTFLNSIHYNKQVFVQETDKINEDKNAELRIKLGIIVSIAWAMVIAL